MGKHFTCLDEANRIARTEQRFIRTKTKCVCIHLSFGPLFGQEMVRICGIVFNVQVGEIYELAYKA